jgi:hypothetical protein
MVLLNLGVLLVDVQSIKPQKAKHTSSTLTMSNEISLKKNFGGTKD